MRFSLRKTHIHCDECGAEVRDAHDAIAIRLAVHTGRGYDSRGGDRTSAVCSMGCYAEALKRLDRACQLDLRTW